MFKSTLTSMIVVGVLAIIAGIVALAWPGVTVLALALLYGLFALTYGVTQIAAGSQLRSVGRDVGTALHRAA
jgi:uncharacterized membrane protein HdeD (DUF308 family)